MAFLPGTGGLFQSGADTHAKQKHSAFPLLFEWQVALYFSLLSLKRIRWHRAFYSLLFSSVNSSSHQPSGKKSDRVAVLGISSTLRVQEERSSSVKSGPQIRTQSAFCIASKFCWKANQVAAVVIGLRLHLFTKSCLTRHNTQQGGPRSLSPHSADRIKLHFILCSFGNPQ